MIKVLLADDHALLRQGLKRVLNFEDDIEIVGEAADGREAMAQTLVLQPDVLLLDMNMPVMNGLEVARQLRKMKSPTHTIALTIQDNETYVLEMLKAGAQGYLLKDVEPETLIEAIHVVAAGNTYIYPQLAERLFGMTNVHGNLMAKAGEMLDMSPATSLTRREMDVMRCIARGMSNHDIGMALGLSEKTVKNHLTNIFHKLGVNDRTQALIYALKNDMVSI